MIVMPANATGWVFHSLARETGRLGHLYSPDAQRGPWPWFPYALDNGAFSCWSPPTKEQFRAASVPERASDPRQGVLLDSTRQARPAVALGGTFDDERWAQTLPKWHRLIVWAQSAPIRPLWAIVPDVPGDAARTLERWELYVDQLAGIPPALAVQNGMTPADVRQLSRQPEVIAVGGTTDWKWASVEQWAREFPRVHVLRCNSPRKLYELEALGVESCDGTGWNRGDRDQTSGLEEWARSRAAPVLHPVWPHACRAARSPTQETFA